ncbi:PleD family two-component system response regulator [Dyadobacter subterraneus]|uniref:Response regulator n=1 Tax=Dyadobacter subterraneus TaxID=2773304 RepID=A0ABR9WEG3_9BACT|nr:response regulator [Dyadobacter subterraneus]MBE9463888.1 response regulator [Dyadobacter subterraneus]
MIGDKIIHLADDDEDDRNMIKEALEEANADVYIIEAENGLELLRNIQDSEDLSETVVIVDMNMPSMNGLETIQALRSDPRCSSLPALVLTTSNDPKLKLEAIKAGANDFFTKPTSIRVLNEIANDIVGRFFDFGVA